MTMYNSVIALANTYNIPDEILDIIFMYINRNMIKSCTDKFMNKDFIRNINRILTKSSNHIDMVARNRFNKGRVMIKLLYPQSLDFLLYPIEYSFRNREINKYKLNMLSWKSHDNPAFINWRDVNHRPLHHKQDNQKVSVEIDGDSMDECDPVYARDSYNIRTRGDLICVIEHKNKLDKVYNDIEPPKYKHNMKTEKYRNMLIPKISDYVRE